MIGFHSLLAFCCALLGADACPTLTSPPNLVRLTALHPHLEWSAVTNMSFCHVKKPGIAINQSEGAID
jgi:hypothetical protein